MIDIVKVDIFRSRKRRRCDQKGCKNKGRIKKGQLYVGSFVSDSGSWYYGMDYWCMDCVLKAQVEGILPPRINRKILKKGVMGEILKEVSK
jgi:hypothetical protein